MQSASDVSTNTFLAVNGRPSGRGEKLPFHKPHRCEQTAVVFVLVAKSRLHLLTLVFGGQTAQACANAWFQKLTNIREVSWLDIVGSAIAATLLEAAIRSVGVTVGKGRRTYWRLAPRFRPILGLAGLGLLVLVTADFLTRFSLFSLR